MDNTLQFISDYVRHEKIAMLEEIIGKIQHNIDLCDGSSDFYHGVRIGNEDDILILKDYLSKLKGEEHDAERKE